MKLIIAYESFPNCPVHDEGFYTGMIELDLEELKHWALGNLNDNHVMDILNLTNEDQYDLEYEHSSHSYHAIKLEKNGSIIARTIDDGRGNKIWDDA